MKLIKVLDYNGDTLPRPVLINIDRILMIELYQNWIGDDGKLKETKEQTHKITFTDRVYVIINDNDRLRIMAITTEVKE